jgi:hypothetical protein
MKAANKDEDIVRFTARLPKSIYNELEKLAKKRRRSINDELIMVLKDSGFVEWLPWIKRAIEVYARERSYDFSEAANNLVSQKISDFDIVEGGIKAEIESELNNPQKAQGQ